MLKVYYLCMMKALSPMRIGGGSSDNSDNDLIRDGKGIPFIPGSSLAGVIRSIAANIANIDRKVNNTNEDCITASDIKELFGDVEIAINNSDNPKSTSSKVLINDGIIDNGNLEKDIYISVRDGVGLDDWGMTIQGAKYDFEVAEISKTINSYIECNYDSELQKKKFERVLSYIQNNGISLGARTSRGYGKMSCVIKKKKFAFPKDLQTWLDFRPYLALETDYDDFEPISEKSIYKTISIDLQLVGDLIISVKEANTVVREDGTNPDDVTIKNMTGKPVIPGTAWAGCFRHHMNSLLKGYRLGNDTDIISEVFGSKDNTRSIINFCESIIEGGKPVVTVRNSIDRFTAAPTSGALFTNESWNGGKTTLTITYDDSKIPDLVKKLLAISIMDLDNGIMTVGGNASVGKGIMKIDKIVIDDKDRTDNLRNYSLSI